jgi:HD-like signal output (HDOD) protein
MTTSTISDQKILTAAKSLPVAPQIMARLHKMLLDSNSGLPEIATLLKRDVSLTTRIIRIANSPAYNGGGLGTIEEALQRVGFGEVFRLVGVAANASLADANLTFYGYSGDLFRSNNLCTALVAERVANKTKTDPRVAYTAGLLRGIGQLLLDRIAREVLPTADKFQEIGGGRLQEWESKCFGITHQKVARLVLSHWGFPEQVIQAAGYDATEGTPATPLNNTLQLAASIVRLAGFGLEGEDASWGIPVAELAATGLSIDDTTIIRTEALAAMQALQES